MVLVKVSALLVLVGVILLVPIGTISQTVNKDTDSSLPAIKHDIVPDDTTVGPVALVDELLIGHSKMTDIMIAHSQGNYTLAGDLLLVMTYVDPDKEELVVVFDPIMLSLDMHPDAGDIEDLLGEDLPIRTVFATFMPESHTRVNKSAVERYLALYNERCSSPNANNLCIGLAYNLGAYAHYILGADNIWRPPTGTLADRPTVAPTATSTGTVIFEDNFEGDLSKWIQTGDENFEAKVSDESSAYPRIWSSANKDGRT